MIRIAVIGAGRIGQVHARAVAGHPGAELAVICDPVEASAKRLAGQYGVPYCLDAAEVFSNGDIDAVIIGSPTRFHVEYILAAIRAGKKVMCEKPIALDVESAAKCVEELGDAADYVMMGFNRRFDPSFAEIHDRIEKGEIGALEQLVIISRDPKAPTPEYVAGSGGIFKDMTIHDFDTARFFLGDIAEVTASGVNMDESIKAQGDLDQVMVTLTSKSGKMATIVNSRHCPFGYDQRVEAFGADGMLNADNLTETSVRKATDVQTEAKGPILNFIFDRYVDAYRIELEHFIDMAAKGEKVTPSVRDGLAALQLAEAALLSVKEQRTVRL